MKTRGRDSAAALGVVALPQARERPAPPPELTRDQAAEWEAVVKRLPADWFPRETWPLLSQYCRHVVSLRLISRLVAEYEARPKSKFKVSEYNKILTMQNRESRSMANLATKMRLSQLATVDQKKQKPAEPAARPWEAGAADGARAA
jgi:hypothetical protein